MATEKKNRVLDIFFRAIRGEDIKLASLANEYGVSEKSVSRDISEIKNFLSDSLEQFSGAELVYDYTDRVYRLEFDYFLLRNTNARPPRAAITKITTITVTPPLPPLLSAGLFPVFSFLHQQASYKACYEAPHLQDC